MTFSSLCVGYPPNKNQSMPLFSRIREDIDSVLERDPAARSRLEILTCYPGLWAVWIYRLSHTLWRGKFYLLARMLLGIVLVFGPICIACSMHRQTAPIFERWMGKVIALTCLEVAGIIVLVMVFAADKTFMDQVTTAHATATGNWPAVDGAPAPEAAEDLANLSSMVVWFGMGAFALYSLPAIAYSIGTGVALSTVPITLGLMSAANAIAAGAGALMGAVAGMSFASNNSGDLSMDFSREEIEGGSSGSLPPPPPPSLSFASSPSPEGS